MFQRIVYRSVWTKRACRNIVITEFYQSDRSAYEKGPYFIVNVDQQQSVYYLLLWIIEKWKVKIKSE